MERGMETKASACVRHPCDLCGSEEWEPLPIRDPRGIGICQRCGFVYVRDRRSSAEIAADWANIYGEGYNPEWPAVKARLFYVAEWIEQEYGLRFKTLLDIGAGRGQFLRLPQMHGTSVWGLEPTLDEDCQELAIDLGITRGTIEENPIPETIKYHFVTILWTLENCGDCIAMLQYAKKCLKPNGRVIVATGSRILVPYKKPLWTYLGDNSPDLHCFRWTLQTLAAAFRKAGLRRDRCNAYMECDWLVASAVATEPENPLSWNVPPHDDPLAVANFFREWEERFP